MQIFFNAEIITSLSPLSTASAVVVDQGRILSTGDQEEVLSRYDESIPRTDLGGRMVIPGLIDAHIHLQNYALSLLRVNCETASKGDCLENVAIQAEKTPIGDWILGHGWNQNQWSEDFGSAQDLDRITAQHPIYLTAKSLHAAWVNSAALQQAQLTAQTPDPPGGRIQRDPDGNPTGILLETAMSLVSDIIPQPAPDSVAEAICEAQPKLWAMGLTGVHDFDRRTCFIALQKLHAEAKLKLRVTKSIPIESLSSAVELGLQTGFGDDMLRIGSLKAFADGALGPRTAAMLQPYENEPDNRGLLMLDAETIFELGQVAVSNGLSMAIHAIGDSANHEVLNAYEQLRRYEHQISPRSIREAKFTKLRHRIEHVQIIHPDDLSRLARLQVIASMQPIHAPSDSTVADRYWGDRARNAYAWRSLSEAGTQFAFGSDAPVESPNPFWGIHAAVTRKRHDAPPETQAWFPEQRISLTNALQGFTAGAAFAAGMEDRLGKLAPGYLADFLVLDNDIFSVNQDEILHIRPMGTMIAGDWVYLTPTLAELISSDEHPLP